MCETKKFPLCVCARPVFFVCSSLSPLPSPIASPLPSAAAGEPIWDPKVFTIIIIFFFYWWLSYNKLFSLPTHAQRVFDVCCALIHIVYCWGTDLRPQVCSVITGPASLAEQIGPEHGCSLLLLVLLLQPDTSVPPLFNSWFHSSLYTRRGL